MAKAQPTDTSKAKVATKPILRGRIDLANETIPLETLLLLPQQTASQYRAIVFREIVDRKTKRRTLALAAVDPTDSDVESLAEFLQSNNGVDIQLYEAAQEEIEAQLSRYLGVVEEVGAGSEAVSDVTPALSAQKDIESAEELDQIIQAAIIPPIVTGIINYACVRKASDIHIEPLVDSMRVRFRVDGNLVEIVQIPRYFRNAVTSRVKILSQLKIDEQRVPQDGRFEFDFHDHSIDIRVSTLPTVHGEKVVMRLLDKDTGIITLEQLGITGSSFDGLVKAINKPFGVILATGPTGSGKSTTLYAILNRIANPSRNVITLEDPVEYEISGTNQSQVKPAIGYTFAEGLRSVLRQDPNIIMVGEIRDLETAQLATQAALTGHLVLTTLHTNDAAGALPRLINIGVEPFLLTSAIKAIMAQRLVRKLCTACRQQIQLSQGVIDQIRQELATLRGFPIAQASNFTFYQATGCGKCTNGFSGRIGIYEVLTMNETIESLAVSKQPASVIAQAARQEGMITLKQDGILKALKGITTMDEIWRVTTET